MFTGLIKEKGRIKRLRSSAEGLVITVDAPLISKEAVIGDSVSVNGACLTVNEIQGSKLNFDVSSESVARTNLAEIKVGEEVNLEDALTPSSRIGGHYVLGHVDGTGRIVDRKRSGDSLVMKITVPDELSRYLVPKGSIAVDGISLTINDVARNMFSVTLVPHTLRMVTLGQKKKSRKVNIEVDILAKSVLALLKRPSGTGPAGRNWSE